MLIVENIFYSRKRWVLMWKQNLPTFSILNILVIPERRQGQTTRAPAKLAHLWFQWLHTLFLLNSSWQARWYSSPFSAFIMSKISPSPSFWPSKLCKWASRFDLLVFVSSVAFCTLWYFTSKNPSALAATFVMYLRLSVSRIWIWIRIQMG